MRILITGVSGFVGAALARHLEQDDFELHGMARDPARVHRGLPLSALHRGDAVTGEGLHEALAGVDIAYYLIHSMEASADGRFEDRDRLAAERFGSAAAAAGVQRIVYLGGPAARSAHLASRVEVEQLLLAAVPQSVMFRASIVISARSRSFRFLVRLLERLPLIALPPWRDFRTQPIDERDVIAYLRDAASSPAAAGRSFEIAGPETVSYGALIERIVELMLIGRPTVNVGATLSAIAAPLAAAVAGEDVHLIAPLMDSLNGDLLLDDAPARRLFGLRLHSLDRAVEHALSELEAREGLRAR
jgi:uncharacterized protein YbjT (DUF2867 family)